MFLMTGVANKRLMVVLRWAALVLFLLSFLCNLVTAMVCVGKVVWHVLRTCCEVVGWLNSFSQTCKDNGGML